MNRKNFLKNCMYGACGCAVASSVSSTLEAAEVEQKEDWRVGFMKKRYNAFLGIVSARLKPEEMNAVLADQGRFCASGYKVAAAHQGDLEGFLKDFGQKADHQFQLDKEKGTLTIIGQEQKACFCPFVGPDTPKVMCNCSLGWMKQTFQTVIGKEVQVTLDETVLRGGKRCTFKITGI